MTSWHLQSDSALGSGGCESRGWGSRAEPAWEEIMA